MVFMEGPGPEMPEPGSGSVLQKVSQHWEKSNIEKNSHGNHGKKPF